MQQQIWLTKHSTGTHRTYRRGQHGATEPHGVPLHGVADHIDVHRGGRSVPHQIAQAGNVCRHTGVHVLLDVTLQALAKVLEHSRAAGQHDVLVQPSAHIDGALHDGVVDHVGQRGGEVGGEDFGIEEHLGAQEALVAHVTGVGQTRGALKKTVN